MHVSQLMLTFDLAKVGMLDDLASHLASQGNIIHARIALENTNINVLAKAWRQAHQPPLPKALLTLYSLNPLDSQVYLPEPFIVQSRYVVDSREVMSYPNNTDGQPYEGALQVCSFKFRSDITSAQALTIWRDEHTKIACDNQSTTIYVQNHVLGSEDIDAIVEEMFPVSALTNPLEFFAAQDKNQLSQHIKNITASSARFIDMNTLNVTHLQAYKLC